MGGYGSYGSGSVACQKPYIKYHIKNVDKKGLEALLSGFSDFAGPDFDAYFDYEDLCKEMKKLDYTLKDVEDFASNPKVYVNYEKMKPSDRLGMFISAAINNVIKDGEKVHINSPRPINHLFYKLTNAEGHVNIAGSYLGADALQSKIYAKKAGESAGRDMTDSEMHVYEAGDLLGYYSMGSKIFAKQAGKDLGRNSKRNEIHVGEAGGYAANSIKDSKIYIGKAGNYCAIYAERSEIHVGEAGNGAGEKMRDCNFYGRKAGDDFACEAFKSKTYVDEVGDDAGKWMSFSELHVNKLGKIGDWPVEHNPHNKVYFGKIPYILPNIKNEVNRIAYKTEQAWKRLTYRSSYAVVLFLRNF